MSRFKDAIKRELDGLHIATGAAASCSECCDHYGLDSDGDIEANQNAMYDAGDEGGFSWSQCDSCGSTLGGDRHAAHGWDATGKIPPGDYLVHLSICTDCLLFHANGDEPETWEARP